MIFCSKSHAHFLLFLFSGRPFALQNCSVSNQSSDSLQVECEPGFDGGLPQHFILELVEMPALRLARNITLQVSLRILAYIVCCSTILFEYICIMHTLMHYKLLRLCRKYLFKYFFQLTVTIWFTNNATYTDCTLLIDENSTRNQETLDIY